MHRAALSFCLARHEATVARVLALNDARENAYWSRVAAMFGQPYTPFVRQ
jgi:hypothetical protein